MRRREACGQAGGGQHLARLGRVVGGPVPAGAAVGDLAWRVVGRHLRARREVVGDDRRAVEAARDRLPDLLIAERRVGGGEPEVDDVASGPWLRLEGHVGLDGGHAGGIDAVDAVHGPALQLGDALGRVPAPADDEPLVLCRFAPVRVVAGEADLRPAVPQFEAVGPGPVDLADDRLVAPPVADTCACSQPVSLIPNAGEAILVRNATSGAHRSNTTVEASLATMRLRLPR